MLNKISFSRLQPLNSLVLDFPRNVPTRIFQIFPRLVIHCIMMPVGRTLLFMDGRVVWATLLPRSVGYYLGNHIRFPMCFHMSDPTIWTASFYMNLFHLVIQAEMKKTQKTETAMTTTWTRQQHAFTSRLHRPKIHPKICRTRNCPTLPLHWIVVTSHLTPRQIKQKVMGIHLFELLLFFFLSTWSLYCEFPINFPSNEFSFIGELFFGLGQISAKITHDSEHISPKIIGWLLHHQLHRGTCDLPRCIATDPCNLLLVTPIWTSTRRWRNEFSAHEKIQSLSKGRPWWIFGCESVAVKQDETCQAEKPIK